MNIHLKEGKFLILEVLDDILNFFFFILKKYININNIFGKKNNKGLEYKKKYF